MNEDGRVALLSCVRVNGLVMIAVTYYEDGLATGHSLHRETDARNEQWWRKHLYSQGWHVVRRPL